jgi:hypothetical protein
MKQLTKLQACVAVALLMVGAVVLDRQLSLLISERLSLAVTTFTFGMLLLMVFDRSPMPRWPRTTLTRKVILSGILAFGPYVLNLVGD